MSDLSWQKLGFKNLEPSLNSNGLGLGLTLKTQSELGLYSFKNWMIGFFPVSSAQVIYCMFGILPFNSLFFFIKFSKKKFIYPLIVCLLIKKWVNLCQPIYFTNFFHSLFSLVVFIPHILISITHHPKIVVPIHANIVWLDSHNIILITHSQYITHYSKYWEWVMGNNKTFFVFSHVWIMSLMAIR